MARQRFHTYSTTVTTDVDIDIDINDILEDLSDNDLIAELEGRNYKLQNDYQLTKEDIQIIIADLQTVEKNSKWWSVSLDSIIEKLYYIK